MSEIIVTTVFINPKIKGEDKVINDIYEDTVDKDVDQLCESMVGFIINTDIINSKRDVLKTHLRNKDYKEYYRVIKKMAKKAVGVS